MWPVEDTSTGSDEPHTCRYSISTPPQHSVGDLLLHPLADPANCVLLNRLKHVFEVSVPGYSRWVCRWRRVAGLSGDIRLNTLRSQEETSFERFRS